MKVTPRIVKRHKTVDYATLKDGDAFLYDGDLCVKHDFDRQGALVITNDNLQCVDMCGTQVTPVDAEITWSYKRAVKQK